MAAFLLPLLMLPFPAPRPLPKLGRTGSSIGITVGEAEAATLVGTLCRIRRTR